MTKSKRIFVSNRLPFTVNAASGEVQRASGGLVSALLGVHLEEPVWWLGFETNQEHIEKLTQEAKIQIPHLNSQPVLINRKLYDSYYDQFCNDVLWPLFHYESQYSFFHRSHWHSYVEANQVMADAILKIAKSGDTVWVHDFHFLLLPAMLKESNPNIKVGLFLHIPFPSSEIFRELPVREEILKAMIQSDLIGFHEHSYLRHFTVSLKAQLGIDSTFFKADLNNHTLHLGVYPISIDTKHLAETALSAPVNAKTNEFYETIKSPFLVLGVDRLDYTKGLELKLRGFRRALRKYPELRGKVNLLQVAIPTRTKVPSYIRLKRHVDELVGMINGEFAELGYSPVNYLFGSVSQTELLALYRRAEALLVTSKRDGMNLVAMEYVVSQDTERPGVPILSEFAGAASLLGHSLIINPWDEDSIADAIHTAWKMPQDERGRRLEGSQEILSKYSSTRWAMSFLNDLDKFHVEEVHRTTEISVSEPWPEEFTNKIASAKNVHLILDYDGTLVSIRGRPEEAVLDDDVKDILRRLQEQMPVYIVSGRQKKFLESQFKKDSVHIAAEHGAFYKAIGKPWVNRINSDTSSWYHEVQKAMQAYTERVPLSFVEEKEACLVWHYRLSPIDFAKFQARKLDDELQVGLANQPVSVTLGSKIVEARAIECNKGNFLRWLMDTQKNEGLVICIGDDRTDEDMFRALRGEGLSIKVGGELSAARFRLKDQTQVLPFLEKLLAALTKAKLQNK